MYVIPEFEVEAYRHIVGFHSKVWRRGDLLVFRLPEDRLKARQLLPTVAPPAHLRAISYWDHKRGLRLFHLPEREQVERMQAVYKEDEEFAQTVSLSRSPWDHIALWSSQRKGFALSLLPSLPEALRLWHQGLSFQQIRAALSPSPHEHIEEVISLLEAITESEGKPKVIRRHDDLYGIQQGLLNQMWATVNSRREQQTRTDPYRLEFQRDRDKILWSKWFRRLASKTQMFPNFGDDRFRSRLTHTLEVAQIARTISRAFGLNEDLTEAIALAHDIGHTPFGHAGEEAINDFMRLVIHPLCKAEHQRTTWFSHYEHGVDVLRWLEDIYFSPGAGRAAGLGVSTEVYDGVFKHMYHRWARTGTRGNKKSQQELYGYSKHGDVIADGFACLEGQAVRSADKICYLVQDLEDGILAGILPLSDLTRCRLFSRPYIDLALAPGETELQRYLSQRGEIINILTKDTLEYTEKLLRALKGREHVSKHTEYVVRPSEEISEDISEVWMELQRGILHKHPRVIGANARASRIVKTLLMLFIFSPDLIDLSFQAYFDFLEKNTTYLKAYQKAVGTELISIGKEAGSYFDAALARDPVIVSEGNAYRVPLRNLILAKDYVTFLTDGQAMQLCRTYGQPGETSSVL